MKIKNWFRWCLAQIAVVTMVTLPLAQGQAAQNQKDQISKAMVQNALVEMGLNKTTTYGEFYKKNKDKYPERIQKKLAPYFTQFANAPMPQFEVAVAKGSDGAEYPVLRISQNGQLHNVQLFGETERYAKFDNTNLTEVDLINFDDMLIRLSAGDAKKNQQLSETENSVGFPMISKDVWTKLPTQNRARYIMSLRETWQDAREVLIEQEKIKSKKTKKPGKKYSWLAPIFGTEAQAQFEGETTSEETKQSPLPVPTAAPKPTTKKAAVAGTTCIVAGYVSRYTNKGVCSISNIIKDQVNGSYIEEANYSKTNDPGDTKKAKACNNDAGFYACNPLIYGTPNGNAICINKNRAEFQKATWWQADSGSSCDQASRLTTNQIQLQGSNKTKAYYEKAAEVSEAQALADQKANNFEMSKNLINGLLKFKGFKELNAKNDPLGPGVFDAIKLIRDNFNEDIAKARASCSSQVENKNEKNFWGACDQLHKRFLFVAELLTEVPGCVGGGKVDAQTLMCACPDGKPVEPGNKCATPVASPTPTLTPGPSATPVVTPAGGNCDPACSANQRCELQSSHNGVESWGCVGTGPTKPPKKKKTSFWEKALPWIAGAGVIAAMYFLWKPKKPKLNGAGDICPNGLVAPCGVQCTPPKVYVAASGCSCAACPPGQTTTNLTTCECGTAQGTTQIVCADGTTIVTDITQCPTTAQYTCWDGTRVTNPINCPERPPGTSNKVNTGK